MKKRNFDDLLKTNLHVFIIILYFLDLKKKPQFLKVFFKIYMINNINK